MDFESLKRKFLRSHKSDEKNLLSGIVQTATTDDEVWFCRKFNTDPDLAQEIHEKGKNAIID